MGFYSAPSDFDWRIMGLSVGPFIGYRDRHIRHVAYLITWGFYAIIMKPIGEIEEKLASKAEPILGFKPSSKIKRGPIGILISIICIAIVFRELNRAGVI
jgi:hypothetical protein